MRVAGQLLRGWGGSTLTPPNVPTLSAVDNGDGTGAVATVAGSTTGSTNTIYYQKVDGDFPDSGWTAGDSRTGNGTVDVAILPGLYWLMVRSTTSGGTVESAAIYLLVTSGADSIFEQCLDAVVAKIQGLSLTGVSSGQIQRRKVPWARGFTPPFIAVCPLPETMSPNAGTNLRDDVGYAIAVTYAQAENQNLVSNLDRALKWRERMTSAFHNQRLTGVDEIWRCTVEPSAVLLPDGVEKQYDAGGFIIRCMSRQFRNLT